MNCPVRLVLDIVRIMRANGYHVLGLFGAQGHRARAIELDLVLDQPHCSEWLTQPIESVTGLSRLTRDERTVVALEQQQA